MTEAPKQPDYNSYLKKVQKIVTEVEAQPTQAAPAPHDTRTSIEDEITKEEVRARKLVNDDKAQDIKLKKLTLNRLFTFLGIETAVIFIFALFQATHWFEFKLEEWSFNLLITATLAQITAMLFAAVRYLFPTKKD